MLSLILLSLVALVAGRPQDVTPEYQLQDITPEYQFVKEPSPLSIQEDLFENRNPDFTDDGEELFESDIVLSPEQKADRKAASNLWPNAQVKYAITSTSAGDRAAIEAGLNHWRQHTCLTFTEVPESFSGEPHLRFVKQSGCWSYIGRIASWPSGQKVSIGSGCTRLGTVAHEVGHAMGFNHEQSRPDRDTYVTIKYDNIISGKENNFRLASNARNFSVPYDLTSLMHYGSHYFTKNGQPTILVKQLPYAGLIGSRDGLSHRDKQLANAMYECAASCSSPPSCQNGGFVDKNCQCVCPPNTSGSNCQTVNRPYYGEVCGNVDMRTEGTISSPNYPSNYPINKRCYWIITAPAGKVVRVTVNDMKLESHSSCRYDWLALRYTGDIYTDDVKACDDDLTGNTYTSTGSKFVVIFNSDYSVTYKGFQASVSFVTATGK